MMRVFLLAALSLFVLGTAKDTCKFRPPSSDIQFDLTQLMSLGQLGAEPVHDGDLPYTPQIEENNTYHLSICKMFDSNTKPRACRDEGDEDAFAYQIDGQNQCHVLGTKFDSANDKVDGFYQTSEIQTFDNYAHTYNEGFQIKLVQGTSKCNHDAYGNEIKDSNLKPLRSVVYQFHCTTRSTEFVKVLSALEFKHCEYTIAIESPHSCPVQCPLAASPDAGDSNVYACAGKGVCAMDHSGASAGKTPMPRCFCDQGYGGVDCSTTAEAAAATSGSSGTVVGLLVVTFLVVLVLLGALMYLVKQIRAYRTDATNYMAIRGNDLVGNQEI